MSTPYDREVVENSSNYDLVNIHWVQNGFLSLRAIQKIVERRPTIITMHDEWFLLPGGHFSIPSSSFPVLKLLRIIATIPTSRLILRRKNHILSLASGIIVPSMWLKSRCLEFGLTAHKVHWIPNLPGENLDLNRTLRPTEEIKIGFVSHGRLFQKQKNFRELYIACQLLRKNGYPIKILVAGATRYPKKIPNWITLEVYEENQMKNFYSQIDLLVLCSKIDNLPQVGIEAQKFGKFLIAKNSGGSAETIANSESGISYTGGQDELANTIKDIIDNNINLHNNALISMSAHQKWDSDLLLDSHLEVFNLAKNKRNI
jgi:glycosyltransferase involved in cell wall biosynthesis